MQNNKIRLIFMANIVIINLAKKVDVIFIIFNVVL